MKYKNTLLGILCGVGGGLMGTFAGRLDSVMGCIFFTLGVVILVFSITNINRNI